jgi:hypothetical protein
LSVQAASLLGLFARHARAREVIPGQRRRIEMRQVDYLTKEAVKLVPPVIDFAVNL